MKRVILKLLCANSNADKSLILPFSKVVPNTQIKIPDNKNMHPPLSRPVEDKKVEKKVEKKAEKKKENNDDNKEEKYEIFLL